MAADRIITCTNKSGDTVIFRETGFFPFLLVSAEGVYDNANNLYLMDNALTDGATFQGGKKPYRNIVLTVKDQAIPNSFYGDADVYITSAKIVGKTLEIYSAIRRPQVEIESRDFVEHRDLLDNVFRSNEPGRLSFTEYNKERVIDYYVEYVKSTGTHTCRYHTISLICPDPYFYNPEEEECVIGELFPRFQFFHEFTAAGEEFGRFETTSGRINNQGDNSIGMTIMITGKADIVNPGISILESGESIKIGSTSNPYTLNAGDKIIITTGVGNKHTYLISNGTTTEINYLLDNDSVFLQLLRGVNTIYFLCDEGRLAASVMVSYRTRYVRA